jgi:hypothetical protein
VLAAAALAVAAVEEACRCACGDGGPHAPTDADSGPAERPRAGPPDLAVAGRAAETAAAEGAAAAAAIWHSAASTVAWFSASPHARALCVADGEAERRYVERMSGHLLEGVEGLQAAHHFRARAAGGAMLGRTTRKLMQARWRRRRGWGGVGVGGGGWFEGWSAGSVVWEEGGACHSPTAANDTLQHTSFNSTASTAVCSKRPSIVLRALRFAVR